LPEPASSLLSRRGARHAIARYGETGAAFAAEDVSGSSLLPARKLSYGVKIARRSSSIHRSRHVVPPSLEIDMHRRQEPSGSRSDKSRDSRVRPGEIDRHTLLAPLTSPA
jgi:hypothetical protein